MPANLSSLRLDLSEMSLGADPSLVRDELLHVIRTAITNHPRSLQRAIGPSELGQECTRRLGYRLTNTPPVGGQRVPWLPTIGTAVHAWLAETFAGVPLYPGSDGHDGTRYLIENRVTVGTVAGEPVTGSVDMYDRVTATVIDWKIVGKTTLVHARGKGPSVQYRTQVQLYGKGFRERGLPVERVAIVYLPRNEELSAAHMWSEHYDETLAQQAIVRADAIVHAVRIAGAERIVPNLPAVDDNCMTCPWYRVGAETTHTQCAGMRPHRPNRIDELLGRKT